MADFLTTIDNSGYNYGTTPDVSVAEQNQTYFAYWNGIGGSRPEYMDGSSYFIKYLIDINGNVVNPEPYTETINIDAVPLHNLKNNFEVGKRAIVKLVEPDPLQNTPTGAGPLGGTYRIAHVGKIIPVLVSETGPNQSDYTTTMSFETPNNGLSPSTPPPTTYFIPNMSGQFQYPNGETPIYNASWTDLSYSTTLTTYTNTNMWTNNSSYIQVVSSSQETHTRIKLKAVITVEGGDPLSYDPFIYPPSDFRLRILQNDEVIVIGDLVTYENDNESYYTLQTPNWIDYEAGDTFHVEYTVNNTANENNYALKLEGAGTSHGVNSILYITQEYPPITTTTGGGNNEPLVIDGVNAVYQNSNYFTAENYPSENGGYSIITCNDSLSNIYFLNSIQIINPASITFGFAPTAVPFGSLKPGDFIRFEYNKNQTYTIIDISTTTSPVTFQIVPSLSTISGSQTQTMDINHFQIYRVLDDGLYVTLDVVPNWGPGGNAYTGLLIPEFISDELSEKLETLIQDLTQKEIIQ